MADIPGTAEPRAAGRRYVDLPDGTPDETPRFALDGEDIQRYIPDPTPETIEKNRQAAMTASEIPHVVYKARVSVIAALRAEGYSRTEIADLMGMRPSGVHWCIRQARKRGLIAKGMEEAIREMDEEAIPLAVETIIEQLREKNVEVAMRVAAGRGLLRTYTNNKNDGPAAGGNSMAFQFNFVMPDGSPAPNASELQGKIFGTGKA